MTSPSIPMLERAARALAETEYGPGAPVMPNDIKLARACLSALIPPSEEMVKAGIKQHRECTDNGTTDAACVAEHVFTAMVQAILTEGSQTP